jgi:hypothetical protein
MANFKIRSNGNTIVADLLFMEAHYPGDYDALPDPPPPAVDMQQAIVDAMSALFDATAQARRYDNRITCALRAGYEGPFRAEGLAFATWMDACNALGYTMLAEVQAGARPMPATVEEALALLPPMVWPT